ncbi:MAG: hypothetical protein AB1650_04885 [Candidatus Omnitrophota bacterium]
MNNYEQIERINSYEMRKLIALFDFSWALQEQRFEDCPASIAKARRCGAEQSDIREVIADYIGKRKEVIRKYEKKSGMKEGRQ